MKTEGPVSRRGTLSGCLSLDFDGRTPGAVFPEGVICSFQI